jgi:hypothetical protein
MSENLKYYFEYIDKLNENVRESIYDYTTERGYDEELNEKLVNKIELTGFYKNMYENIMYAFDNAPDLSFPITLYRGWSDFMNVDFNLNYFYSTSYDVKQALKFVEDDGTLYVITCTPGKYGILPIQYISESPSELEIMLPPRGKFSIQNIIKAQDSIYKVPTIYITYIPHNAIVIDTEKEIIPDSYFAKLLKRFINKK